MTLTGTVTDMIEFCKAWEELENLIGGVPLPERHRARDLMGSLGQLVRVNMSVQTFYSNLIKAWPEDALAIECLLRQDGYGPALDGC